MNLALSREFQGTVEEICTRVTEGIKSAGFGILSRIDFDQKIKEKLGHDLPRIVILGACNPQLAYSAFQQSTDVALLIPCNIVVRETGPGLVLVEVMRPTQMLAILPAVKEGLNEIQKAEDALAKALAAC